MLLEYSSNLTPDIFSGGATKETTKHTVAVIDQPLQIEVTRTYVRWGRSLYLLSEAKEVSEYLIGQFGANNSHALRILKNWFGLERKGDVIDFLRKVFEPLGCLVMCLCHFESPETPEEGKKSILKSIWDQLLKDWHIDQIASIRNGIVAALRDLVLVNAGKMAKQFDGVDKDSECFNKNGITKILVSFLYRAA